MGVEVFQSTRFPEQNLKELFQPQGLHALWGTQKKSLLPKDRTQHVLSSSLFALGLFVLF